MVDRACDAGGRVTIESGPLLVAVAIGNVNGPLILDRTYTVKSSLRMMQLILKTSSSLYNEQPKEGAP